MKNSDTTSAVARRCPAVRGCGRENPEMVPAKDGRFCINQDCATLTVDDSKELPINAVVWRDWMDSEAPEP
jgi:hypothetical protein